MSITITAIEFTGKSENTGMIFATINRARVSYDTFTIVYHIDISEYLKQTKILNECVKNMEFICSWIEPLQTNCKLIVEKLRDRLKYMTDDETNINSYRISTRSERGLIDLGGKVLNFLYGVIDADTAKEYMNEINNIKHMVERTHRVRDEQLSIVRETIAMSNKTYIDLNNRINDALEKIGKLAHEQNKNIDELKLNGRFLEMSNIALLMVGEHERLSNQILRNLENTLTGKMSQLIPTSALRMDIGVASKYLGENQMLPIEPSDEDILHIYRFTTARAALISDTLLVEMTFPIIEREKYTLYKTIPIPVKTGDQTIITTSKSRFFLLGDDMAEYIPIGTDEYSQAVKNKRGELIFNPAQNAHFTSDESCEMSILLNPTEKAIKRSCDTHTIPTATYFIAVEQNLLYYVYVQKTTLIREHCSGKPTTTHELVENGYIKLDRNCRINTDKISIRPHLDVRINSTSIIKLAESTQNITFTTLNDMTGGSSVWTDDIENEGSILIQNHESEYAKLIAKTDELIREQNYNERFAQIDSNDLKTGMASSSFAIFITVIIVISVVVILYKKFFGIAIWQQLAKTLEGQTDNIPKLFIRYKYPNTPSTRKRESAEVESEF